MNRDPVETAVASNLKIAVASPNPNTADYLRSLLESADHSLSLTVSSGGVEQAGRIAEKEHPDVFFVEGVRHDEGELAALERVTPRFPNTAFVMLSRNQSPEFLRHGMRIGLREILPMPVARDVLLETIGRIQQRIAISSGTSRTGKIFAFVGCKGGSGATFLATNLAYVLAAQETRNVALIDLNCQFGDASLYVSENTPVSNVAEVARQVHRLDGDFLASSMMHVLPNFHVLAAPEDPEQALHIDAGQIETLLWVAASHYDMVIIDAGRSLDEVTMRAMDQCESVFAVLQLSLPFVRGAKRLLHALRALGYERDKLKLIVNRCEKKAVLTVEEAAKAIGHEVFMTFPESYSVVSESVNQGVPISRLADRDPVAKKLQEMAGILAAVKKPNGSWLKHLLPGL